MRLRGGVELPPADVVFTFPFHWTPDGLNKTQVPTRAHVVIYMLRLVGALSSAGANVSKVLLPEDYVPTLDHFTRMLTASFQKRFEFKYVDFEKVRELLSTLPEQHGFVVFLESSNGTRCVIFFKHDEQLYVWDSVRASTRTPVCPLSSCASEYSAPTNKYSVLFASQHQLTDKQATFVGLWQDPEPVMVIIPPPPSLPAPAPVVIPPPPALPVLSLSVLRNCNAKERFDAWKQSGGTLLGLKNLGCGINALTFLGVLSRQEGERLVPLVNSRGTTLAEMVTYVYQQSKVSQFERYFPIRTVAEVQQFITTLGGMLHNNECTIAKLMRYPDNTPQGAEPKCIINGKKIMLTPGHSIVFSKDEEGTLHFLDPHLEIPPKPSVNAEKAFGAWNKQCYVAVGLLFGAFEQPQPARATQRIPEDVRTISRQDLPDHGPYLYRTDSDEEMGSISDEDEFSDL